MDFAGFLEFLNCFVRNPHAKCATITHKFDCLVHAKIAKRFPFLVAYTSRSHNLSFWAESRCFRRSSQILRLAAALGFPKPISESVPRRIPSSPGAFPRF